MGFSRTQLGRAAAAVAAAARQCRVPASLPLARRSAAPTAAAATLQAEAGGSIPPAASCYAMPAASTQTGMAASCPPTACCGGDRRRRGGWQMCGRRWHSGAACSAARPAPRQWLGGGSRASWRRHPTTGEEWLCQPCYFCIRKRKQQQQAETVAAEEEQQPGHRSSEADAPEGGQAPAPQPLPASRKRRRDGKGAASEVPAAFFGGPAAAAERGAGGLRQFELGSAGGGAVLGQEQQKPAGQWKPAPHPAVQQRQRRKQTQPQHLPAQQ